MAYTVKKLSELSGVTVRALHYYEEIGLLKPAYYGSNGYRYYQESQLLQLQQILFFKELGFTLKQIQKVAGKGDFDQISALYSHRKSLSREWERLGSLLKTIDKTIEHLKGKRKMKDKEIFDGFNISLLKAKEGQSYSNAEKLVAQSVKDPTKNIEDVEKRGELYYDNITKTTDVLFRQLAHCIEQGLDPTADEVQKIIKRHHILAEQTLTGTREVYMAMAELYVEHPEFRKQLEPIHLNLATFMAEAMKVFADKELT